MSSVRRIKAASYEREGAVLNAVNGGLSAIISYRCTA